MASIQFTSKDIFDKEFKTAVRGYNKEEVDEFLDDIIKDYETYAALVKELQQENKRLKQGVSSSNTSTSQVRAGVGVEPSYTKDQQMVSGSNYDILRRLNRLEKEVFGKQIVDQGL